MGMGQRERAHTSHEATLKNSVADYVAVEIGVANHRPNQEATTRISGNRGRKLLEKEASKRPSGPHN